MLRQGHRVGTCVPVLCELHAGIGLTTRRIQNERILSHLAQRLRIWPTELSLARNYGELFRELRQKGRVLSQVDMMIAALCRSHGLTLVTSDRDFEALPDLVCENWLQS